MEENEQPTPPQYYVTFMENGNISGFYVDTFHKENIPEGAVPISIEQWETYSAEGGRFYKQADSGDDPCRLKTQDELDAENAANYVPPVQTPEQLRIEELEAQVAAGNDATLTAYDALADVYEMVLALQDQVNGGGGA